MKPKIQFLLLSCVLCTVSSVAIGGKEHQMFKHLAQAYSTCNAYYLTLSKAYERKSLEAQAQEYDGKARQMFSYSLAAVLNYTKEKKSEKVVRQLLKDSVAQMSDALLSGDVPASEYRERCEKVLADPDAFADQFIGDALLNPSK